MEGLKNQETNFRVQGMDCEDETEAVQAALLALDGVVKVEPNIISSQVRVVHSGIEPSLLIKRIESVGLKVQTSSSNPQEQSQGSTLSKRAILVGISGIFISCGLVAEWFSLAKESVILSFHTLSILVGGCLIAPKAVRALRSLRLDMNVLMMVAAIGAVIIRQFAEAAAVVFLFALAEWLEGFSLQRARRSIQALLKLVPETALVEGVGGQFVEVAVSQVEVGQLIRVKSGQRIPLDGTVK